VADDDRRQTSGLAISSSEITTEGGPDAEQREIRPGDDAAANTLGYGAVAEGRGPIRVTRDSLELRLLRVEGEVIHD
jgi:hypothetical protein